MAHLQDHNTYKPLTHNSTSAIANDACTLMEYMHSQHITEKATIEFLLPPTNISTPLFYELAKIHKPNYPLHSIVSRYDALTDHLSV